jgi:hypothetical protein
MTIKASQNQLGVPRKGAVKKLCRAFMSPSCYQPKLRTNLVTSDITVRDSPPEGPGVTCSKARAEKAVGQLRGVDVGQSGGSMRVDADDSLTALRRV